MRSTSSSKSWSIISRTSWGIRVSVARARSTQPFSGSQVSCTTAFHALRASARQVKSSACGSSESSTSSRVGLANSSSVSETFFVGSERVGAWVALGRRAASDSRSSFPT
ncbi:hypothetical protein QEG98_00215 [Myxococcus sp. MxC21-1]|uniref:hypothetical protein n=1 Tax=Myxococcus sp. MxC21-1 TaxID=3041439 RepID=UPI00292F901C|nr:hypothetical protein [Myxococcus sp. MxC21-1]WNZ62323.1 hypothetical protein QEG98_00215 [Myxococcus sp. MxC21-1]